MITLNIDIANEYSSWDVDINDISNKLHRIFYFYMGQSEITDNFCLKNLEFNKISFDILLSDGHSTHQINKEYRKKDYPADIITFATFADSPDDERFILDMEINLGEIIIGLDRIEINAKEKDIDKETELIFMLSHGIMHLLGFDHQTENDFDFVVNNQKKALSELGIIYDKI